MAGFSFQGVMMSIFNDHDVARQLERIAEALERLSPPPRPLDPATAEGFLWDGATQSFSPVARVRRLPLALLKGVESHKRTLLDNTRRFAAGLPANNALLWGARGMGKSALIKAVFGAVAADEPRLRMVEIDRDMLSSLPRLMRLLRAQQGWRFIVFCDDMSFDADDDTYKTLKAALEGGMEGRPENVVFYATSNRRHLLPREMIENERERAIHPTEAEQEKVSLSDRFGLWLGFYPCDQDTYLDMVRAYAAHFDLKVDDDALRREALEWAATRGARSGRVAWQFITDLAGRLGARLDM